MPDRLKGGRSKGGLALLLSQESHQQMSSETFSQRIGLSLVGPEAEVQETGKERHRLKVYYEHNLSI